MSTPRRRHSPAVYRRRRLVLLVCALVVIASVVLLIWQPWRGGASPAPGPSPSTSTVTPGTPAPSESASADPTEGATPSPAPSSSADAIQACSPQQVMVEGKADKESYAAGEDPQLTITLTNTGAADCTINVGSATQVFTVSSGSDVWWRSTDCQANPTDQIVTLKAGQTASSSKPVPWDRTRSSVDTCDSENRPHAGAGGATYRLSVSIGGIASAQDTQFFLY